MQDDKYLSEVSPSPSEAPEFFTVGTVKLILMAVTTFGIYELYWFYRNWRVLQERQGLQISPFWRAFFAPLWAVSFGRHLANVAKENGVSVALPAVMLGLLYFLLSALWKLPDPYWLLSMLTFLPVLAFEFAARRVNGRGELATPTFGRYSTVNIAWLVVGSVLLLLAVIGTFLPEGAA
jgi:hypothetical protein